MQRDLMRSFQRNRRARRKPETEMDWAQNPLLPALIVTAMILITGAILPDDVPFGYGDTPSESLTSQIAAQ